MKTKIVIGLLCIAAVLAWTGTAGAQPAPSPPKVQLPSGEVVWDLTGDWAAFVENYGPWERVGTYFNVWRITQTSSTVSAIRLLGDPRPAVGEAESPSLRAEVDKGGFKHVEIEAAPGIVAPTPSQGQISEDGTKIILDDGIKVRVTLTRPGDPERIKAILLRPTGWKADWGKPGGIGKGVSELICEVRGDKIVAKLKNLTYPITCERDVRIIADTVIFDGCNDWDIRLRFDPNDQTYPFKGNGRNGDEYKVQAK